MSITGDIYNIDQSLTGEGVTDLELNTLVVDGTFQNVNADFYKNITSNIQTQLNLLSQSIINNENLDYAFLNSNNIFTGSLNKFNSIECSSNVKTLTFNGYQASFLEGATSNLQQQINSLTSGSPINGQSATISIGTTTTLSSGSNATVTNSGNNLDAVFNFGIPQGLQGIPGNDGITPTFSVNPVVDNLVSGSTPYVTLTSDILDPNQKTFKFGLVRGLQGIPGNDGITPTFSVGSVTSLASTSTPSVTIENDTRLDANGNLLYPNNKVISFGLVQGSKGDKGEPGSKGDQGEPGKKGDKGDTGSGADASSIAGLVLGGAGLVVSIGTLLALFTGYLGNGLAVGANGAVTGTLVERVLALEQKTFGLTYNIALSRSTFDHTIQVSNLLGTVVRLNAFEQSEFNYGLNVPIIGIPIIGDIVTAVSLNKSLPSVFNLGIITTGLTAGAIGCASVTIISPIGGFLDVTGLSNFTGDVSIEGVVGIVGDTNIEGVVTITGDTNFAGAVTIEGETNFEGAVTMQGTSLFEAEANFAGAVTIEAIVNITGDTNIEGVVTITGDTNFAGAVTIEGETNFEGAVTMQGTSLFEAEANFAGAVTIEAIVNITGDTNIEGVLTNTGNMEIIGGNITQTQVNDEETGLPIPLSNTLFDTTFSGNITQTNLFPDNPFNTPPTTTLLETSVTKLTLEDGDITQTLGTTSLYNLNVENDVNLNGLSINIGDNFENNVINIGNSQSTLTFEGDSISIGVASVANTINIGNSFTTLTLRSVTNEAINIENAMNQMDMDIASILNEMNFL